MADIRVHDYQIYYVGTESEVAHHAASPGSLLDIRIASPDDVQRLAKPGDLAIFFSEHFHRFRNAWFQLNRGGCPTLYAIDGILEWRNAWETGPEEPACPRTMRPVLSDKVACIGPSQARVLDAWGNRGKTEIVGLPRLDPMLQEYAVSQPATSEGPFRILVTTAKWPGYTPEQVEAIRQSLSDLLAYSLSRDDDSSQPVEWTWRLTGDLAEQIGVENELTDTSGRELAEVLDNVDAVITTPSTVLLEAMLKRRPVAILDYTNSPVYCPAAWHITARPQIAATISQLMNPPTARVTHQEMLLSDALQVHQPAAERMAELCQQMIRIAHDCRIAGHKPVFPANLLDIPVGAAVWDLADFGTGNSVSGVAACTAEFDALASENQRQLGVLQRRVELLEFELERAADGFRKIANHPILGPLLKVRQTAIRFGNQISNALSRDEESESSPSGTTGENPVSDNHFQS